MCAMQAYLCGDGMSDCAGRCMLMCKYVHTIHMYGYVSVCVGGCARACRFSSCGKYHALLYLSERAHQISHFRNTSGDGQGHRRAIGQMSWRQRKIHKPGARVRRAGSERREVRTGSTVLALSYNHNAPSPLSRMARARALGVRVRRTRARMRMWTIADEDDHHHQDIYLRSLRADSWRMPVGCKIAISGAAQPSSGEPSESPTASPSKLPTKRSERGGADSELYPTSHVDSECAS